MDNFMNRIFVDTCDKLCKLIEFRFVLQLTYEKLGAMKKKGRKEKHPNSLKSSKQDSRKTVNKTTFVFQYHKKNL